MVTGSDIRRRGTTFRRVVLIAALIVLVAPVNPVEARVSSGIERVAVSDVSTDTEWSPLFDESLRESRDRLEDPAEALPTSTEDCSCCLEEASESEDVIEAAYVPQYTTSYTCGTTCGTTCASTCYYTCGTGATCYSTCSGATCGSTCQSTCVGTTCTSTCAWNSTCIGNPTCGSTCSTTCAITCGSTCGTTCTTTCGTTCTGTTCDANCDDPPDDPSETPHDPYIVGDTTFWPLWGPDRFETAVAISQDGWERAETVLIATGRNWPDALGGAGLAGALGAPILLSDTNSVPQCTLTEIQRLGAGKAVILGGQAAVGAAAQSQLVTALGAGNVTRIGGSDRYQTAELVARAIVDLEIEPVIFSDDMSNLSGWDTSDHRHNPWTTSTERFVSTPASAAHTDYVDNEQSFLDLASPLDFTEARTPELTVQVWYDLEDGYDYFGVLASGDGGDTWDVLDEYTGDSDGFEEIAVDLSDFAGDTEVIVSFGVVTDSSNNSNDGYRGVWIDDVRIEDSGSEAAGPIGFVATGRNFPDALAAAPVAATSGRPLLLMRPGAAAPVATLQSLGVEEVLVLGGTEVVSSQQETQLVAAFGATNVRRLAGANRYATAAEVATWGVTRGICGWNGLALATGERFPDALTGGALQAQYAAVMLLTRSQSLSPEAASALRAHNPDIRWMSFLGGSGAISEDVRRQVEEILRN